MRFFDDKARVVKTSNRNMRYIEMPKDTIYGAPILPVLIPPLLLKYQFDSNMMKYTKTENYVSVR